MLLPVHTFIGVDNRVTLPKPFSDHLPWIKGTEIQAWLLLLETGRYRLLSDEDLQDDPHLEPMRLLILREKPFEATPASYVENSGDVASVARLIPIEMKFHKGSWRIPIPDELRALAPVDCNPRNISFLFSPRGFVEIWYTDVLRLALKHPWHD